MYWYPTILPYERHGSLFHIQTLEFWHPEETDLMLSLDLKGKNQFSVDLRKRPLTVPLPKLVFSIISTELLFFKTSKSAEPLALRVGKPKRILIKKVKNERNTGIKLNLRISN